MLAAYGWICGIFIGIPALLMSIANPSVAAGILASVASFVLPCLLTGALLCDWAGQGLAQRKWPAFCRAGLSLLAAALERPVSAAQAGIFDSLSSLAMSLSVAKTRVGGSMGLGPKRRRWTYATKSYLEALAWDMVFVEDWPLVEKIIYIQVFHHALILLTGTK
jgi:hypothetical protein